MTESPTPVEAFKSAVAKAGGNSAFSRIVGCTPGNISQLLIKGSQLPDRFVLKAEAETGISRHALRPDLYPDESGHDAARADDRRRPADPAPFGDMEPAR